MTPYVRHILTALERLGYHVLSYHRGVLYIAGSGFRDTQWAIRVIRRAAA